MSYLDGIQKPLAGTGVEIFSLAELEKQGSADVATLPVTVKILLENALRFADARFAVHGAVEALAGWHPAAEGADSSDQERPFMPGRVLLQDFTGVPAVVDMAAMRDAVAAAGGDYGRIDPLVPVDLVVDHSVQVDAFGSPQAYERNIKREYERNSERYQLLRWAQQAFATFRVVPPGMGIVHQVNLEYLAHVVQVAERDGVRIAYPDTLVGTDSHTTMVNGIGVLGWGVGGIEAEAVMLGQPLFLLPPVVVGVRFEGELVPGTTATDLVLTLTEMLRKHGVVGKFVEFCGDGLGSLSAADRATMSNMAPEYGATAALFPVDDRTLEYLRESGRSAEQVELVERYTKAQGMFRTPGGAIPHFSELLQLDLGKVVPSLAGPRRPQDRVDLPGVPESFTAAFGTLDKDAAERVANGSVVIAAITSCTNTSNPSVMVAAGLLARRARERGMKVPSHVKTSLAPGSRVVTDYLQAAGLMEDLEALRFNVVGYGCTTCIGNSGPLDEPVAHVIDEAGLAVAAVLSGNRNFEGRIHPQVKASYLASPPLVVAYALAGSVGRDLSCDPVGEDRDGNPVYLKELWPTAREIEDVMRSSQSSDFFGAEYGRIFEGDEHWKELASPTGALYEWDEASTYVRRPPFFEHVLQEGPEQVHKSIEGMRVLALLGDSITTDHISPAGSISPSSPAAAYLKRHSVEPREFNTYGARRGNHEVMVRGTFANIRLRNQLAQGREGGYTEHFGSGEVVSIYDAAQRYQESSTPLLVIAGREYGSGSSRDWAAKGTLLLGVQAVIAESFERIHRSNLVGMGVLPLQFLPGEGAAALELTGRETYSLTGLAALAPGSRVTVVAKADGQSTTFDVICRLDSATDLDYYRAGGVLSYVLRNLAGRSQGVSTRA